MRFFALLITASVGLGCAETASREARSPDEENNEEVNESQSEDSESSAEVDEDSDEHKDETPRPAKKRRPKRRKHVQAAPEPEAPPMYRKPLPPPPVAAPPPEEPPPAAAAYSESADQGEGSLEAEARKRCRWKQVPPYRPDWASTITPPLAQQRKITSKPICPYGTPPAVLRVARQIAVEQTKLKKK